MTNAPDGAEGTGTEARSSVLVGFDGSPGALTALRWALAEAERRDRDVTVLQSWHEPVLSDLTWRERWDDPEAEERAAAAELEQAVAQEQRAHPGVRCRSVLVADKPGDALVDAGGAHDLIVVGSRGRGGFAALTLGSVAEHVAAMAPVTVVVVRTEGDGGAGIVVGLDGSAGSRRAVLWAAEEGRVRSAGVRAVLAWTARPPIASHGAQPFGAAATDDDARLALHRTLTEQLGAAGPDQVELVTANAPAARALLEAAAGAELLVVGSDPTAEIHHERLGSVARQVLRHAPCPVVIAR